MSANPFRMNRFTLCFADAAVETAYAEEHARTSLRQIRIMMAAVLIMTILRHLLETSLGSSGIVTQRGESTWIRPVGLALAGALIYAWSYWPQFRRRQQAILIGMVCLYAFSIIRLRSLMSPDLLVARGYVEMLIVLFTIYTLSKLQFPPAALAGWLTAGAYLGYLGGTHLLDSHALARHGVCWAW